MSKGGRRHGRPRQQGRGPHRLGDGDRAHSALLFARAGVQLVLADVREDALAATVHAVRAAHGAVASVTADLAIAAECPAVVDAALAAWGRLDVLFNNAGVSTMVVGGIGKPIDLERWDLRGDRSLRAIALCSRI